MKRSFLEDLGLEKDAIDSIMKVNGEDIENAKAGLKDKDTEINGLNEQIKGLNKQLEDLKKSAGDNEDLKKQIEQMQETNKANEDAHKAEIKQLKLDAAIGKALSDAKAKNHDAVKALLKDIDLAEDGTVKGLDEQLKALQKSDNYLFDVNKAPTMKGAIPGESGNDDGEKTITKEQFNKMSYKAKVKLFEENKELYDSLNN